MDADFRPMWGRLDTSGTAHLAVRADADGFTVSTTGHDLVLVALGPALL